MSVIRVEGLRKVYRGIRGQQVAVAGLDMEVPEGGVFGFLGPNGSGKTTTIRCILGLVRPTSGSTSLLGARSDQLDGVIGRVGALVEKPSLFPTFTARENLRLLGAIDGIGAPRVAAVLARVGLEDRADDLVRKYSLGMKQRLAIAAALLKDPSVLILDEPANGLDPAGIRDVRDLIRSLGAEGRTVFLSSHILSEIEQVADRVAILARGRCIATGPVADVLSRRAAEYLIRVADTDAATAALRTAGFEARHDGGDRVVIVGGEEIAERVARALFATDVFPVEMRAISASLEDIFLELTADDEDVS